MTQPVEAVGGDDHVVPAELTPEERLNAAFDDPENRKQEEEPAEGEGEAAAEEADDETVAEEEADDLPPIDAPVSWDTEAKELFKSLPREAQEIVQKREAERERFVQQKSQEATRAKQDALQEASSHLAQIEQAYAQQWAQVAQSIAPQRPDPSLLATNPYEYAAQQQRYDEAIAQREQAQQTAQQYAQQAQARVAELERQSHAEQHRIIVENFPEYADPATGPELQRKLTGVAKAMGYSDELIGQARATDILAVRTAAEWKDKADKYDALMKQKMEKVRAAKDLPKVTKPGSAQAPGAHRQNQYAADREAMRNGDKDAERRVLDSFFQPQR